MSTRDQLISAAAEHLRRQGLDGLTLRGIARAVGVSHAAPARHFDGVASLLAAVASDSFRRLNAAMDERVEAAGRDPVARLAAAGEAYAECALAYPAEYELMFRPERLDRTDADYLDASLGAWGRLAQLVEAAQLSGWNADVNPVYLTGVVWSSIHGVVSLWIQGALPTATGATDPTPFVAATIHSLGADQTSQRVPRSNACSPDKD